MGMACIAGAGVEPNGESWSGVVSVDFLNKAARSLSILDRVFMVEKDMRVELEIEFTCEQRVNCPMEEIEAHCE